MAPRLKIVMTSGSKKGTQIYFSFHSKALSNEPPPGSPTGPLWRARPVYRVFCISLKNLIFQVPLQISDGRVDLGRVVSVHKGCYSLLSLAGVLNLRKVPDVIIAMFCLSFYLAQLLTAKEYESLFIPQLPPGI